MATLVCGYHGDSEAYQFQPNFFLINLLSDFQLNIFVI